MVEQSKGAASPYSDLTSSQNLNGLPHPDDFGKANGHASDDGAESDDDSDLEQALLYMDHEDDETARATTARNYDGRRPWRRRGIIASMASLLCWPCFRRQSAKLGGSEGAGESSSFRIAMRTAFNYPEPGIKLRKTAWLDALRGLAALEVFIFHYSDDWIEKFKGWGEAPDNLPDAWWTAPFLRSFYSAGNAAVCLFFAISGYVLTVRTLGLIRRRQVDEVLNSLSSAVMRRGIRLYLPVFVTTLVLMNVEWIGFPRPTAYTFEPTYLAELWRWWMFVTKSWMPLRYPDRFEELLNYYDGTISWTIPIEYYGSIVTYIALLFTARVTSFRVRAALFSLFIVMFTIKDEWYVVQFLIGALYAEYQLIDAERAAEAEAAGRPPPAPRFGHTIHKAFAVFLIIFGFYLWGMPPVRFAGMGNPVTRPGFDWLLPVVKYFRWYESRQVDRYFLSFAADCILVGAGELSLAQRFLELRPCQYLGRISFGLYLSHIWVRAGMAGLDGVILSLVGLDPDVELNQLPMGLAYAAAFTIRLALACVMNFFVAGMFEKYLDQGSVKLAKRFEQTVLRLSSQYSGGGGLPAGGGGAPIELGGVSYGGQPLQSHQVNGSAEGFTTSRVTGTLANRSVRED